MVLGPPSLCIPFPDFPVRHLLVGGYLIWDKIAGYEVSSQLKIQLGKSEFNCFPLLAA